ncbi:putative Ig domain-containing protein [Krasilnikovia sp. M28-CT-15]|uniref:putative Ig domain-containing protein n=1 Tax=Krasilnikovia sp. M28-CT-15 TaxID=3373540 RepID=UPI003876CA34
MRTAAACRAACSLPRARRRIVARPAWSRRGARPARVHRRADDGFTLVEVMVSLAVIGTVMTALAPFLIRSLAVVAEQRSREVAVQLASDAIERARALTGTTALAGRSATATNVQWTSAPTAVRPYLLTMSPAWDKLLQAGSTAGADAGLPTSAVVVPVNGITYSQNWYLGTCRQQFGGGGSCDDPAAADPDPARADVPFLRVVAAVTWPDGSCPNRSCTYVTTTLISSAQDPVFNLERPAPIVDDPGPQTGYAQIATPGLQLTSTGGTLPLTWTVAGLPPGLTVSDSGMISGTPDNTGADMVYTVTATVKDRRGRTDSASFPWTIWAAPVLMSPGDQSTHTGSPTWLAMGLTHGVDPITWTATGLPAGLAIDRATGVISGTPTASSRTVSRVTVTATDKPGRSSQVSFDWTVVTIAMPALATRTDKIRDDVNFTVPAPTGGVGPYTYRIVGVPGDDKDISIDPATGVVSGKIAYANRFFTTVTVTDANGDEVTTTFLWNVQASQPNDLVITAPDPAAPDQTGKVGRAVALNTDLAGGSSSAVVWSATGLPPGLSINPRGTQGGVITGTPTTAGTFRVALKVVDSTNKYALVVFDWTVLP